MAQEILTRVLEGARQWNPDQHGELLDYLIGQVRSIVYHSLHSWSGKYEININEGGELTDEEMIDKIMADVKKDDLEHLYSPEMIVIDKENEIERSELLDLIIDAASGIPELEELVEAYLSNNENYQRRYIAERLGITPDEVTNRSKKLSRRTKKLYQERKPRKEISKHG